MNSRAKYLHKKYREKLAFVRKTEQAKAGETLEQKRARIEHFKKDYAACFEYYFEQYATSPTADFHVKLANQVKRDPNYTGLIRWGRGLAKSVHCDIGIPFWLWLNGEPVFMVIVGENETKASLLLGDIQAELEANPRILHDFGDFKGANKWESGFFISDQRNQFIGKAIGMRQDPRGLRIRNLRPNLIIPDDIDNRQTVNNPKRMNDGADWIEGALMGTMDGEIERFMMPLNYFAPVTTQEILRVRHPDWKVSRVDACPGGERKPRWHTKYSPDYYKKKEKKLGTVRFNAEYNNDPKIEGKIFKNEMIEWGIAPRRNAFVAIVGQWDVAYSDAETADYNAVRIMGIESNGMMWHLLTFCRQAKMSDVLDWMYSVQETWPKTSIIHWRFESQFWNEAMKMEINAAYNRHDKKHLNLSQGDRPVGSKYDRILRLLPHYQAPRIRYDIREVASNDMQEAIKQLMGIEPGYSGHDDAPDAEDQAVEWLLQQIGYENADLPELGERSEPEGIY